MIKLPIFNQMEPNLADMVIWKRRKKEEILLRTGKGNNDTNDIINYHLDKNKQIHLLSKNSPQCKLYQGSNFYIGSIDKKKLCYETRNGNAILLCIK
jgi:hypothetical protein